MTTRSIALKRISNDLKELAKSPLEGIGIAQLANDPMKYVINMELMTGPYLGYKVQLLMTIFEDYPIKPPKLEMFPNQLINSGYHNHIFGGQFCIDLLLNIHMNINAEYSGWNPSYTISTILLQIQNFISDPDGVHKSKSEIEYLMNSIHDYKKTFEIIGKDGERTTINHTWKEPYPKMYYKSDELKSVENSKLDNESKMKILKENLTCYVLRDNYIDNPEILLGYPIVKKR